MIVTDGIPRSLPDMFLRVQLGAGGWEMQSLDEGMGLEKVAHDGTFMPGSTIPEQEQRSIGVAGEQFIEKLNRCYTALFGKSARDFMARHNIQGSIKMPMIALWADAKGWRLPPRRPDPCHRGLKIQAHLIHRHNHTVWVILAKIGYFFSNSASNSATTTALG